ncbi:MAG: PhoH family protein [Candidatus Eisenbacteria sp.]|nr:PhoH family protein [Candidatus Eisenbacteria bacterium]
MSEESQRILPLEGLSLVELFGEKDRHLRALERRFGVRLVARDAQLIISGSQVRVDDSMRVLEHLVDRVRRGDAITQEDLTYAFSVVENQERAGSPDPPELEEAEVLLRGDKRFVKVRTFGQARYLEAMKACDITFVIGPAGTGKTYLAVAWAVRCLKQKLVDRIILVRPAVEAGESLGFLPGDLREKVDPYLRPLYDALRDMVSYEKLQRFLQLGVVEVAPLAYMRGRTLSRAFVILDEAQNTTLLQMKMFLTRLGPVSRAVITGDVTQIDLDDPHRSGLVRIRKILDGVEGIGFVSLSAGDVVRHRLVRSIINAFEAVETRDNGSLE